MFLRSLKPQWHRVYYMLALFDVLVVLMGLYLTHRIIDVFDSSVATNLVWEQRLDRYLRLGEIAATVNAPGNDIFDTHQIEVETQRMSLALETFQQHMNELRLDARTHLNPQQSAQLLGDLDVVDAAMQEMTGEAARIFTFFAANQRDLAGARMASMDRKYHTLNQALTNVRKDVSAIQLNLFATQQATTATLQKFEFVIAGFVLLMISAAAVYGYQIRRRLEMADRERERYVTELQMADKALQMANIELERKVEARTAELVNTNIALQTEISERKRAEEELRQNEEERRQWQKMEAVGRLAGGIAHDFNNIVAVIMSYSELLLINRDLSETVQMRVQQILKASQRAAELTGQLLAFSRKQVLQPQVIDLNLLVVETEKLLGRLVGEHIELKTELNGHVATIEADPNQIQQVLMNLAINARDAMVQGGRLTIATKIVVVDADFAYRYNGAQAQPYVVLTVTDTGQGMDPETQAHIFEPFFTTKERGKGTGLGLSTVYGIVQQSGGFIRVQSSVAQGSSFEIYLPYVNRVVIGEERLPPISEPTAGSETILLVEDDAAVREITSEVLSEMGYSVLTAASGQEALIRSADQQASIHLLITDVVMPGMNGREVAEQLTRLRPALRVLYMSGYTNEIIGQHGILDGKTWFIQKPFSIDALVGKVRTVLDASVLVA